MTPKKITVEAPTDHPEVLDVKEAMQQVIDYFDLLTEHGQSNIVWNLVFASTNSPFTAEATPVDLRTKAPAFGQVRDYVAVVERGLVRLQEGLTLDEEFPSEKREVAKRIFKRNLNGIGRTVIDFGESNFLEISPRQAERSLAAMNGEDDEEYDYLFGTFSRKEFGSIEGRIVDLSTDYEEPSIKLKEHRSGREIQCRISNDARDEIENSLTAGDVWTHRRARVRGMINYDPNGKIVRVYDGRIAFIETKDSKISDLRDPGFTGGLPAYEYIDKLRENELG